MFSLQPMEWGLKGGNGPEGLGSVVEGWVTGHSQAVLALHPLLGHPSHHPGPAGMQQGQGLPNLAGVTSKTANFPIPLPALPYPQLPTLKPVSRTKAHTGAHPLSPFPSHEQTHPRATFSRRTRITRKTNRTLMQRTGSKSPPPNPTQSQHRCSEHMPHSPSPAGAPDAQRHTLGRWSLALSFPHLMCCMLFDAFRELIRRHL